MELVFKQKKGLLGIPLVTGTRWVPAFSRVRNELNGKRPDPANLPDVEHSLRKDRSLGEVCMPRPFPLGTFRIYALEVSEAKWTKPTKILTDAHQLVPVFALNDKSEYDGATGRFTDDWCYWIHYANGSYHTDGCIGVVNLVDLNTAVELIRPELFKGTDIFITSVDE